MSKKLTEEEFLERLKEKNPHLAEKVIRVIGYEDSKGDVTLDTIYGTVITKASSVLRAHDLSIKSATDKTFFWVRRNEDIREDYKDIDYSSCNYVNNSVKVNLICKKHNYTYSQRPSHHTAGIQGCAYCMTQTVMYTEKNIEAHRDFIESIEGVLYILKLTSNEESFYKVGIVSKNRFIYRISQLKQNYDVSVLYTEENDMVSTFELEQRFLKEFKYYKYEPKIKFIGYTECLTVNPLDHYYKQ